MKPEAFEQRERVAGSEVELDAEIRRERDTHVDRAGGFVAVDADAADTKLRLFDDADHRRVAVEDARHAGEPQRADPCRPADDTSEPQYIMPTSYAIPCLTKTKH